MAVDRCKVRGYRLFVNRQILSFLQALYLFKDIWNLPEENNKRSFRIVIVGRNQDQVVLQEYPPILLKKDN